MVIDRFNSIVRFRTKLKCCARRYIVKDEHLDKRLIDEWGRAIKYSNFCSDLYSHVANDRVHSWLRRDLRSAIGARSSLLQGVKVTHFGSCTRALCQWARVTFVFFFFFFFFTERYMRTRLKNSCEWNRVRVLSKDLNILTSPGVTTLFSSVTWSILEE